MRKSVDCAAGIVAIELQHAVGGLLALPAVVAAHLGSAPTEAATVLCVHSALCAAGWQAAHLVEVAVTCCLGGEPSSHPPAALAFFLAHHSCGIGLALTMNLSPQLRANADYHEVLALLQLTAVGATALLQISLATDISTERGLRRVKLTMVLAVLLVGGLRGGRLLWVAARLLGVLRAEGAEAMGANAPYYCGLAATCLGALFNGVIVAGATRLRRLWPLGLALQQHADEVSALTLEVCTLVLSLSKKRWARLTEAPRMVLAAVRRRGAGAGAGRPAGRLLSAEELLAAAARAAPGPARAAFAKRAQSEGEKTSVSPLRRMWPSRRAAPAGGSSE